MSGTSGPVAWTMMALASAWLTAATAAGGAATAPAQGQVVGAPVAPLPGPALFEPAATCVACHTGLVTPRGEDMSFATPWATSMMANSARDPYWQAAVRREITDHPTAAAAIENECGICHMPMAHYPARSAGRQASVFAQLPIGVAATPSSALAADGVSCSVCHQIGTEKLGDRASFTGGFHVDTTTAAGARPIYGAFDVDAGRRRIMKSASGFVPERGDHLAGSEVCATCHTLITHSLDGEGRVIGELPEQVPYHEWRHSAYRQTTPCQSCHMPVVEGEVPITTVMGQPRPNVSRHEFRGGNSFMTRLFARFGSELGVASTPQDLDAATTRTETHLQTETARLSIEGARIQGDRLVADVAIENLAGHKLPTAYPSRRVWVHLVVRDAHDGVVFESGGVEPTGAIRGNDHDADGGRYEPHYTTIERPDQVQIYESVMADPQGGITTGLLTAVQYVKDNRILPRGFDKATAEEWIAVHGRAADDADFTGGGDRVRYAVPVPRGSGPYRVEATLYYQTIGFRWAENFRRYGSAEPQRFVRYYEALAPASPVRLATAAVQVP